MNNKATIRYAKRRARYKRIAEKLTRRTGFLTADEVRATVAKFLVGAVKYPAYDLL